MAHLHNNRTYRILKPGADADYDIMAQLDKFKCKEINILLKCLNFLDLFINRISSAEKIDVIIFGASGFAGRHTVLEAVTILKHLRWGIAGRNKQKLKDVLDEIASKTQTDLSTIPIWVTNINDRFALGAMAKKCRIVINCCGPYMLYGEAVVRACIAAGTHHVDLSAEPQFLEMMQLKYNKQAKENNVYIVSACGFFCIPVDIGVNYVRHNFEGTLHSIEAYTEFWSAEEESFGPIASVSVWASIVLTCASLKEVPALGKKICTNILPKLFPTLHKKVVLQNSEVVPGACIPFPVIDTEVVECSQYYFYKKYNTRPLQFDSYISFPSALFALIFLIWFVIITFLAQFQRTRDILLRHPKIFSLGLFSSDGPSEESLEKTFFRITFLAVGWPNSDRNPLNQFEEPPEKLLLARVSGKNPVYGVACVALLTSAVMILEQCENMTESGGVFSPGAAFATTDIVSELQKHEHGINFEIKEK